MSGDVGRRRRVGRRRHGHVRAGEGPLDRAERPRPAPEDRPRAQAHRRRHLRDLRAMRQADREGAHQGPAVRRPLHQGRPGAVAPLGAGGRGPPARRPHPLGHRRRSSWLVDRLTKLWAERALPRPSARRDRRGRRGCGTRRTAGGAFSLGDRAPLALRGRRDRRVRRDRRRRRSARGRPRTRSRSGWSSAARSATSPTGSSAGPGLSGRVVDFIDLARLAGVQPRRRRRSSSAPSCSLVLVVRGRGGGARGPAADDGDG